MDRHTRFFWGCILALTTAAVFFGIHAERMRRSAHHSSANLENGALVHLVNVIDGDTVVVAETDKAPVAVRILGIKAFEAKVERDPGATYGRLAMEALDRLLGQRSIRVLLNVPPKDKYGRHIATLWVGDQDVGLGLVRDGLALVYPVYPFAAMTVYLQAQELARAGRRGLWASNEMTARAQALMAEWQERTP